MGLQFQKRTLGDHVGGKTEAVEAVMTFDSVYTTGGELLDAKATPLGIGNRLDAVDFEAHPTYAFELVKTDDRTGQLFVYQSLGGLTEVPNGTDLSALAIQCKVTGR